MCSKHVDQSLANIPYFSNIKMSVYRGFLEADTCDYSSMSGFRCEGVSEVQCCFSCDNIPLYPASIIPYWYY